MKYSAMTTLLCAALLVACSPSVPALPAGTSATKADLPTDFMGLVVGGEFNPAKCDMVSPAYPCMTGDGYVWVDPDTVPAGFPFELRPMVSDDGTLEQLTVRIASAGFDQAAALVKKYGAPDRTGADGSLHWTRKSLVVAYLPTGASALVVVATPESVQRQNAAAERAKARSL